MSPSLHSPVNELLITLATRKRSISRAPRPIFATLVGTWRTSSIDHSQAATTPFFPPRHPGILRPSFRVLRPPISDLRPLYLNLTPFLPNGLHRDIVPLCSYPQASRYYVWHAFSLEICIFPSSLNHIWEKKITKKFFLTYRI